MIHNDLFVNGINAFGFVAARIRQDHPGDSIWHHVDKAVTQPTSMTVPAELAARAVCLVGLVKHTDARFSLSPHALKHALSVLEPFEDDLGVNQLSEEIKDLQMIQRRESIQRNQRSYQLRQLGTPTDFAPHLMTELLELAEEHATAGQCAAWGGEAADLFGLKLRLAASSSVGAAAPLPDEDSVERLAEAPDVDAVKENFITRFLEYEVPRLRNLVPLILQYEVQGMREPVFVVDRYVIDVTFQEDSASDDHTLEIQEDSTQDFKDSLHQSVEAALDYLRSVGKLRSGTSVRVQMKRKNLEAEFLRGADVSFASLTDTSAGLPIALRIISEGVDVPGTVSSITTGPIANDGRIPSNLEPSTWLSKLADVGHRGWYRRKLVPEARYSTPRSPLTYRDLRQAVWLAFGESIADKVGPSWLSRREDLVQRGAKFQEARQALNQHGKALLWGLEQSGKWSLGRELCRSRWYNDRSVQFCVLDCSDDPPGAWLRAFAGYMRLRGDESLWKALNRGADPIDMIFIVEKWMDRHKDTVVVLNRFERIMTRSGDPSSSRTTRDSSDPVLPYVGSVQNPIAKALLQRDTTNGASLLVISALKFSTASDSFPDECCILIEGLNKDEAAQFIRRRLGRNTEDIIIDRLYAATAGHVGALGWLCGCLAASSDSSEETAFDTVLQLISDLPWTEGPTSQKTLDTILEFSLAELGKSEKEWGALAKCAVFRKPFPHSWIGGLGVQNAAEVTKGLQNRFLLQRNERGLLQVPGIVRQIMLQRLSYSEKRTIAFHRQALSQYKKRRRSFPHRPDYPEMLFHAEQAKLHNEVRRYEPKAYDIQLHLARKHLARRDYARAIELFLTHIGEWGQVHSSILVDTGRCYLYKNPPATDLANKYFEKALELNNTEALPHQAVVAARKGDLQSMVETLDRCFSIAASKGLDSMLWGSVYEECAACLASKGEPQAAITLLRRGIAQLESGGIAYVQLYRDCISLLESTQQTDKSVELLLHGLERLRQGERGLALLTSLAARAFAKNGDKRLGKWLLDCLNEVGEEDSTLYNWQLSVLGQLQKATDAPHVAALLLNFRDDLLDNLAFCFCRARVLYSLGRQSEAVDLLSSKYKSTDHEAITSNELLGFRGLLNKGLLSAEDAISLVESCLEQEPSNWHLHGMLGRLLLAAGKREEALSSFTSGVDLVRRMIAEGTITVNAYLVHVWSRTAILGYLSHEVELSNDLVEDAGKIFDQAHLSPLIALLAYLKDDLDTAEDLTESVVLPNSWTQGPFERIASTYKSLGPLEFQEYCEESIRTHANNAYVAYLTQVYLRLLFLSRKGNVESCVSFQTESATDEHSAETQ